jgi:hypothetical protein
MGGTEWVIQQDHAAINTAVNIIENLLCKKIYSNECYTKMRSIPTFKFVYRVGHRIRAREKSRLLIK